MRPAWSEMDRIVGGLLRSCVTDDRVRRRINSDVMETLDLFWSPAEPATVAVIGRDHVIRPGYASVALRGRGLPSYL